jgi:hypothetical protein
VEQLRKLLFGLVGTLLLPVLPAFAAGGATYGQISPLEYAKGPHTGRTVEFDWGGNSMRAIFIYRTATSAGPGQSVSIDGKTPASVEAQTFIYKTVGLGDHKLMVPEGDTTHTYDFSVERGGFGWIYIRLDVISENGITKVVPARIDHETAKMEIKDCRYLN